MEAAGIEPADDSDATADSACDCEVCQECRAAYALHFECFKSRLLASFDADLQQLMNGWACLPEAIRAAIIALAESQQH
jgi:hypothetical protein